MKKLMLICAPVSSRSGYGAHARDLVWSFVDSDKYDIKIIDVRWGECPRNALDKDNSIKIYQLLININKEKTIIVISHNLYFKEKFNQILEMRDGNLMKVS